MKIVIEDYHLEQSGDRYDLYWTKQTKGFNISKDENGKKTRSLSGEDSERVICLGYSMPLERCVKKIIANNLENIDLTVTLKEYLNLYKEEREKISKMLTI